MQEWNSVDGLEFQRRLAALYHAVKFMVLMMLPTIVPILGVWIYVRIQKKRKP